MAIPTNLNCLLEQRQPLGGSRQAVVTCHDLERCAAITCNNRKQEEQQGAAPETPSIPFSHHLSVSENRVVPGPVMQPYFVQL